MNYNKSILYIFAISCLFTYALSAQQTYMSSWDKFTSLLDTKLLKTGELVIIEKIRYCQSINVKLINSPEDLEKSILQSGNSVFYSFNELPDNNWVFILITDPSDDVPVPFTFHTIVFVDGEYEVFSTNDEQTPINLENVTSSAVINGNELVLSGSKNAYFTDFKLSNINTVTLNENLSILKSPEPSGNFLYYKYFNDDAIKTTGDKFETEENLAFNLGSNFRDIHYLGDYAIFQDENELSAVFGLFGFFYIEQNKKIYEFRQQGQNLRYYTISSDSILTFKKLYLDIDEELQIDSFNLDLKTTSPIVNLHWDGNFKGYAHSFLPLPPEDYENDYIGYNYILNYDMQNTDFTTENLDISIDDITYITKVDTTHINAEVDLYYADINMEITLTNNTDQQIQDVHLYSTAFEGINCAHNWLKVEQAVISLQPNETVTLPAKYTSLEFNSETYLKHPLCIYAIGANNKPDDNFSDNIFCLPLSEFTSTDNEFEITNLSVYPNPAQNRLQINSEYPNSLYEIYTLQGKLVTVWDKKTPNEVYDISNLKQGTFLIIEKKSKARILFTKI